MIVLEAVLNMDFFSLGVGAGGRPERRLEAIRKLLRAIQVRNK